MDDDSPVMNVIEIICPDRICIRTKALREYIFTKAEAIARYDSHAEFQKALDERRARIARLRA